jgi:AcrR family transcriptional regulator
MTGAPKTRYHHGSLESALVGEAVHQIRERGADQVSLRGLAQTIGVSPSAAYQHFPDKAALLAAVCVAAGGELAEHMRAAVDAVDEPGEAGAIGRFLGVGRAYVEFAAGQPHLYRHLFGPAGADDGAPPIDEVQVSIAGMHPEGDDPYAILLARIEELGELGLLRGGVKDDPTFPLFAWSLVHGFSSLVIEGHLPVEAGEPLLSLFGRLVLTGPAFERFEAALAAGTPS